MYKEGNTIRLCRKSNEPFMFGKFGKPDDVTVINGKSLDFRILEVRSSGSKKIRTEVSHNGETHKVWFFVDSLERIYDVVLNNPIQVVGC